MTIETYAQQIADCLSRMDDIKVEMASIVDAAKAEGIDAKALRRVAKELNMDREKLERVLNAEEQLDLFRSEVGLLRRKGIEELESA